MFGANVHLLHLEILNSKVRGIKRLVALGAGMGVLLNADMMPTMRGTRHGQWSIDDQEESLLGYKEANKMSLKSIKGFTPAGIILLRKICLLLLVIWRCYEC